MRIEEIKEQYVYEYTKYITKEGKFDQNDYVHLIDELYGNREISFEEVNYKFSFSEDSKNVEDGLSNNYKLEEKEIGEILISIYNEFEDERLKEQFLLNMLTNSKDIPYNATEYFERIKNEKEAENKDVVEDKEEINNIEEETPDSVSDDSLDTEDKKEKPEEELEGPAIIEYKAKTEEMEKELEELLATMGSNDDNSKEMDDIINNTSYPEIEEYEDKISKVKEEINGLDHVISSKIEEKEKYEKLKEEYTKFYEEKSIPKTQGDYRQKMDIYDQRIKECEDSIKSNTGKKTYKERELDMLNTKIQEVSGPLYRIEVWKFAELYNKEIEKLENNYKELKEIENNLYKELKGIPLEIYGMQTKLQNQIKDMKQTYNDVIGIRSEINLNNPQFKPVLDAIKNARKINNEVNEELNEKYRENNNERINQLREEIEKRKENIAKYYDVLADINNLEKGIKEGKTLEELQEKVDEINNKINSISDDKLKEELKNKLNKVLEKTNEITPEGKTPEPKPNPEPTPKKGRLKVIAKKALNWIKEHKLAALGIGLALGTVICYATMPAVQMMINSCLWNVGKALGWSSSTLGNLHNANLGLSAITKGGKYAFEAASGAYTLGGVAGAEALYSAGGAGLVTTLMGLGYAGGIAGIIATIKDRIQNRKKKNKKDEVAPEKEVEEAQPTKEEIKTENKDETVEKTKGEEFTPEQKEKIQMMINEAVQTSISKVRNDLVNNMVNAGLTQEQIETIIKGNPTVNEEIQPETGGRTL